MRHLGQCCTALRLSPAQRRVYVRRFKSFAVDDLDVGPGVGAEERIQIERVGQVRIQHETARDNANEAKRRGVQFRKPEASPTFTEGRAWGRVRVLRYTHGLLQSI